MTISKDYARRILNNVINTRGYINISGYDTDQYTDPGYWEDSDIEGVQEIIDFYEQYARPEAIAQSQRLEQLRLERQQSTTLKFKKLDRDATAPQRSKELDAGYDITSCEDVSISPGESYLVSTGIAIETPRGTYAAVHPRSGMAAKHRVTVLNAPGTVDEGYRGEVKVNIINHGGIPFNVRTGMKIAQLIIQKYETPDVIEVDELSETERGVAGHGSTGEFTSGFFPKGI